MKKIILFLLLGVIQFSTIANVEIVQINGAMTTGVNGYYVPSDQQYKQVDVAFNLDFTLPVSSELTGFFQIQGGAGGSYLGFPGAEAVLTDINVTYQPNGQPYSFVFGSFDTPFGQQTNRLSNNADMSANLFVKNPLLYATLAGYVGTLNTLGLMTTFDYDLFEASVAVTNGTAESAANDDGNFETVLRIVSKVKGFADVSFSYLFSDDQGNTDSFDSLVSGWMIDLDKQLTDKMDLLSYFSQLSYNDKNALTEDTIQSHLIELQYHFSDYSLAVRYDSYQRADQASVNSDIPTSFLSYSSLPSGQVYKHFNSYSFGYQRSIQDDVQLKAEMFLETGDFEQQAFGSIIYVTFFF